MIEKMGLVPFEPSHAFAIKVRKEEQQNYALPRFREYIDVLHRAGNCYTFFSDGEAVFSGGVQILWPGVGEAWVITSAVIPRYARKLVDVSNSVIAMVVDSYSLLRVQAHIRVDWNSAANFIERLRFEREGLLRKYMCGDDYYIYARTKWQK